MISGTQPATGVAFSRRRVTRVAAGVASSGVMAALGLAGATPALAATEADCDYTFTAPTDAPVNIQTALNTAADGEVLCISGTFTLTTGPLVYFDDVTILGLADAVLDGADTYGILIDDFYVDNIDGSSNLTVQNIRFTNGNADSGGAIGGGGDVTAIDSVFDNNFAAFAGGAIYADNRAISEGSVFTSNGIDPTDPTTFTIDGGAISAGFSVTATDSTFTGNRAFDDGGAIGSYGFAESYSSTFVDNQGEDGGAISGYAVFSENSTFQGNSADLGGAIITDYGIINQSTFLNNTAVEGQSIYKSDNSNTVQVVGNIFAGGTPDAQLYADTEDPTEMFEDLGGNVFSTATGTEFLETEAPSSKFSKSVAAIFGTNTAAFNGGIADTVALPPGSVAIDAVPAGGEFAVLVDERGVARDDLSDAGAYEAIPVLADTGLESTGWIAGLSVLFLAAGAIAVGFTRRSRRLT